ncbi:Ger(x)C family spore germination protein [Metabacillus sp. cB07]|uniref:Ger(x)C family spore germination protein n=1 Tax=Metabacillus sp. cB07 TaxID=2806989 RepID=UPI00193AD493|nr:Ger(x)C family spore germination protein [Metabacillus sp. cB07]
MKAIYVFSVLMLMIAGCGRTELNDLIVVSGIGIDRSGEGMLMHFQVINPSGTAASQSGAPSGGSGGPVYTYSFEGENASEILQKAKNTISRKLYFSHVSTIVVSERFAAEEGLLPVLEFTERFYQMRRNVNFLIAKDSDSSSILKMYTPIQKMPALSLESRIPNTKSSMGFRAGITLKYILKWFANPHQEPFIFGVEKQQNQKAASKTEDLSSIDGNPNSFTITGLALFKKDKLVDWLTYDESRSLGLMKGLVSGPSVYTIDCPNAKSGSIILVAQHMKGSLSYVKADVPSFQTRIRIKGFVQEASCSKSLDNSGQIKQIEKLAEKKISGELQAVFEKVKDNSTDSFGLRRIIFEADPSLFKKWEPRWEELYQEARLSTDVTFTIENTGLRMKSMYEDN